MVTKNGASGSHGRGHVLVVTTSSRTQRPGSDAHLEQIDRQLQCALRKTTQTTGYRGKAR